MTPKKFILSALTAFLIFSCSNDDNTVANTAPVISDQTANTSENILDTDIIYQVTANDADGDALEFTLDANSDALFELSGTGALSLATGKILSFATKTQHLLTIGVTDGLTKVTATLTVNVTENESPSFSQETYEFSKPENIPDSEIIGTVEVTDLDNPDMLEFSITDDDDSLFEINNDGQISLREGLSLDFENKTKHTLEISVTDGSDIVIAQVDILVENVADTLAEILPNSPDSFIITFVTKESNTTITIPTDEGNFQYNYSVSWGDGASDEAIEGNISYEYAAAGEYKVAIQGTFPAILMEVADQVTKESLVSIDQWGNIEWQSMEFAFFECPNVELKAEDTPNLSLVGSMGSMFKNASSFNANLGDWIVSNVTDMTGMLDNSGISSENYGNTLLGWYNQGNLANGVVLGAEGIAVCSGTLGDQARLDLADVFSWVINDEGVIFCP
nr:cadherin domain-containing protein [uncultured Allomuricauda sp.]